MVKVEIFFNDTFGGSFADGRYGSDDRFDAYRTAGARERRPFDGYEHGDVICKSMLEFERHEAAYDYITLAWHAVAMGNRDDRANGRFERSFSTGDVIRVTINDGTEKVKWLASNGHDLLEIEEPREVHA